MSVHRMDSVVQMNTYPIARRCTPPVRSCTDLQALPHIMVQMLSYLLQPHVWMERPFQCGDIKASMTMSWARPKTLGGSAAQHADRQKGVSENVKIFSPINLQACYDCMDLEFLMDHSE